MTIQKKGEERKMNINNKKNKRGMSVLPVFIILGIIITSIIGFGLIAYGTNQVNSALMSVDGLVGQVDFQDATSKTWGKFNDGLLSSLNWLGIALIFGLMLGMTIVAYFTRGDKPVLMFIVDIILMIVAFIVAGYISDSYEILIGVEELSLIFIEKMNMVSRLMLNLPVVITIFGAITMIISYMGIPQLNEEKQVAGF